jgi:ABC-type glycerol-3-phosphate transport system permease component
MTLEADHADIAGLRDEPASSAGASALRHIVINLFNLIILLPLAWVLIMSVKSLPDAMRGDFWPGASISPTTVSSSSTSRRCR